MLNLSDLNVLIEKKVKLVDAATLLEHGMLRMKNAPVKVLWKWEISGAIDVKVAKVSATAVAAIEKAGGTVEQLELVEENTQD